MHLKNILIYGFLLYNNKYFMKPFPQWNKSFIDNLRAAVIHIQFKSEQTLSHPLRRALCFVATFNAFPFVSIFCSQENKVLALLHPLPSMERSTCLLNLGSLEEIPALDTMFQAEFSLYFVRNS